jgi:hypothetical protein
MALDPLVLPTLALRYGLFKPEFAFRTRPAQQA